MNICLSRITFLTLLLLSGLAQAADDVRAVIDGYMTAWNAMTHRKPPPT